MSLEEAFPLFVAVFEYVSIVRDEGNFVFKPPHYSTIQYSTVLRSVLLPIGYALLGWVLASHKSIASVSAPPFVFGLL